MEGWGGVEGSSYVAGKQRYIPTSSIYNSHKSEQLRVCELREQRWEQQEYQNEKNWK